MTWTDLANLAIWVFFVGIAVFFLLAIYACLDWLAELRAGPRPTHNAQRPPNRVPPASLSTPAAKGFTRKESR